jgi:hypothetical protein
VGVTYGGGTALLCVDAAEAGRNSRVTVGPRCFGSHRRAVCVGRSRYADPHLKASVDDFRVYGRVLTAEEVTAPARA